MVQFINPYNFVPFGEDIEEKRTSREGLYRSTNRLNSGWLNVAMYVRTPVIVPDGAHPVYIVPDGGEKEFGGRKAGSVIPSPSASEENNSHKEYDFFHYKNEAGEKEYRIPGSELRGMLRSSYEAVTDSCFPFLLDDRKISQRVPAFDSLNRRGLLGYDQGKNNWVLYSTEEKKILKKEIKGTLEKPGKHVDNMGWLQYNEPVSNKDKYHIAYLNKKEEVYRWNTGDDEPYEQMKSVLKRDNVKGNQKHPNKFCANALLECLEKAKKGGNNLVPVWFFIVERVYEADGKKVTERLAYLSNSSVGRIALKRKWKDVIGVHSPCQSTEHLCPACLLFGTAAGGGMKTHIRVSDAIPDRKKPLQFKKHCLSILGEPRTSAFEFYLEKPEFSGSRTTYWNFDFYGVSEPDSETGEDRMVYEAAPRGRKMYWHSEPIKGEPGRTRMNATMEAVEQGAEFTFRIYFDEITDEQLKELIWLISLGDNVQDSKYQYKLGHAKPLGYGSVKLKILDGWKRKIGNAGDGWFYKMEEIKIKRHPDCPFDMESDLVRSFLELCNVDRTSGQKVDYPHVDGKQEIFHWFSLNRKNPETLKVLPKPVDMDISLDDSWKKKSKNESYHPGRLRESGSGNQTMNRAVAQTEQNAKDHAQSSGSIKMFNKDKGFGFIKGRDGKEYYFRFDDCEGMYRNQIAKGSKVYYDEGENANGLCAFHVRYQYK